MTCECQSKKCHHVIDSRFVEGRDLLKKYPNSYVQVRDENAVYHVSQPDGECVPTALPVSRTIVFYDNYNPRTMPKYRSNIVVDMLNNQMYIFDQNKDYRKVGLNAGM